MSSFKEYIAISVQLVLYFIILYTILLLNNNLNLLLVESNPVLVLISLIVFYYLSKRIIEFLGIDLTNRDVNAIFFVILLGIYLDSFKFLLSNFYLIIGLFFIFDLYYVLSKSLPIDFQLILLQKHNKIVYTSADKSINIRVKGFLFKTVIGSYNQKITSLPGGKLDDLYKLIIAKNVRISEIDEVTYFKFKLKKNIFFNQSPIVDGIKKELENTNIFIRNTLNYCISDFNTSLSEY